MRTLIFVLISCFLFSSVANSAMLCCMAMGDKTEKPTCHDDKASDVSADIQGADQPCDCDNCFQKNLIQTPAPALSPVDGYSLLEFKSIRISLVLEPLYYPPIRIS